MVNHVLGVKRDMQDFIIRVQQQSNGNVWNFRAQVNTNVSLQ